MKIGSQVFGVFFMSLIVVRNLSKIYTSDGAVATALAGVSFSVAAGEFVAIMGPSGSGKSTLLHILGFLDRETGGTYRLAGKPNSQYGPAAAARVRNQQMGFVFQAFNLLPRTSVLANVKLPLFYSSVPEPAWEERARSALGAVGLGHRLEHAPGQLSGGEKQRAAIARALVLNPQVIFADEPTGNLDSGSGRQVMDIFQRLNKEEGRTIVLITHETDIAERAGRIIRLRDGRVESDEIL